MNKILRPLVLGAGLVTMALASGNAEAAVRFHSGPTATVSGTSVCTSANVSGLGNENIVVTISADYAATTTCRNKGGNVAPGQPLVEDDVTTTSAPIEPKNGRAQISFCSTAVQPSAFDLPPASQVCPNGNWSVDPIQQGDISLIGYTITARQGSTVLYTCTSSGCTTY